jgi:hypothetical protein
MVFAMMPQIQEHVIMMVVTVAYILSLQTTVPNVFVIILVLTGQKVLLFKQE